ncbi:MAG: hypothetical protein KDA72_19080 [Planctomycetales bacterium]|nr:hypothetical protein [Planctomycetales bacterium]
MTNRTPFFCRLDGRFVAVPGDDDEIALWALEIAIMSNPLGGSVIRGTGGLRKLRFAAEQDYRGKRGADRICYAYYPDHHIVLMVAAFPKNRKANISEDEKKGIKKYLDQVRNWLDTNEDGGP